MSIINVYVPTEEKTENEKVEFYERLEEAYNKHNISILIGNINAKIRRERMYKDVTGTKWII